MLVVSPAVLVAEVIAGFLGREGGFEASWCDPSDAPAVAAETCPDIILAEVAAEAADPEADRWGIWRLSAFPARLVLLVREPAPELEVFADAVGSAGWLTCHVEPSELIRALRALDAVGRLPRMPVARAPRAAAKSGEEFLVAQLTTRERQVLSLLASGSRAEVIADALGISQNTVRTHVQNVMLKLAVHSRLEAVALAHRVGLTAERVIDLREHKSDRAVVSVKH